MLTCIIVDDQARDRENLKMLLNTYCPDVTILGEAFDNKSLIRALDTYKADLIFLDINLGNTNCFDIMDDLDIDTITAKIIFVTAHENYAVKGYGYNAIDYMLKPILPEQLIRVVYKAKQIIELERRQTESIGSLSTSNVTNKKAIKLQIKDGKNVHFVKPCEILCLIGGRNYTTIKLINNGEIITVQKLKDFEFLLNKSVFLRVHRSYIINVNHVSSFSWDNGFTVSLENEVEVPVSRNYKQELLNAVSAID